MFEFMLECHLLMLFLILLRALFGSFLSAVERCQFSLLLVAETLYIKWQYDCFPSGGIDFVTGLHAEVTFVGNVFCFECLWRTEAFAMSQRNLFCYAVNYHVAFISTSGSFGGEDQQILHLGRRIKAFGCDGGLCIPVYQ